MPGSYPLVALVILDGWGCAAPGPGNAVELAATPVFDRLWREYPHTTLKASGEAVGLPSGQMGNSEVGHLTIGSGRVLLQDLMRVNRAIADGSIYENEALRGAFERGDRVHLLGVAVVGCDHCHTALALDGRHHFAEAVVRRLHGCNSRGDGAGVPDHVGIRKVQDRETDIAPREFIHEPSRHLPG